MPEPLEDRHRYGSEMISIAFGYQKNPKLKKYYTMLKYALELVMLSGEWEWYEKLKARKIPFKSQYKKFLENNMYKEYMEVMNSG